MFYMSLSIFTAWGLKSFLCEKCNIIFEAIKF